MYDVYWMVKDENGGYKMLPSVFSYGHEYGARYFAAKMVIANSDHFQGFAVVKDTEILYKMILKNGGENKWLAGT